MIMDVLYWYSVFLLVTIVLFCIRCRHLFRIRTRYFFVGYEIEFTNAGTHKGNLGLILKDMPSKTYLKSYITNRYKGVKSVHVESIFEFNSKKDWQAFFVEETEAI